MKVEYINHSRILFVGFYIFISRRFLNQSFNRASGPPPQDRPSGPSPQDLPPQVGSKKVVEADEIHVSKNFESCLLEFNN